MSKDGVVIGLDDPDGEGESGEGILDKGFGSIGGHFFMELDEAQAGTAVNGRELVEAAAFEEVRDEFDIDLDEVAWARDGKDSAVAFGPGFSFPGEAVAGNDFADGKGRGDFQSALVEEELAEAHGSQVGLFS